MTILFDSVWPPLWKILATPLLFVAVWLCQLFVSDKIWTPSIQIFDQILLNTSFSLVFDWGYFVRLDSVCQTCFARAWVPCSLSRLVHRYRLPLRFNCCWIKHVWYRLAILFNITMFRHQTWLTMFGFQIFLVWTGFLPHDAFAEHAVA